MVLPTEGLILACLVLGKDRYAAEYELGVANLLRVLDVQGQTGRVQRRHRLRHVHRQLDAGRSPRDGLAGRFPRSRIFVPRGFPTWAVHHLQPGRFRVNCFDARGARTPRNDSGTRQLLETLAVFARSQAAARSPSTLYDGPTNDLAGLLAGTATLPHVGESLRDSQPVSERPAYVPTCFACYDGPARRVNWRSSWTDDADGVWVRGGHPLDGHDHFDCGHVNYIVRGKPLLIEAGTPGYDNPAIHTRYSTVVGHNLLEVEGIKPRKAPAPLTVSRLDAGGGDLTVDGTACYPGLKHW